MATCHSMTSTVKSLSFIGYGVWSNVAMAVAISFIATFMKWSPILHRLAYIMFSGEHLLLEVPGSFFAASSSLVLTRESIRENQSGPGGCGTDDDWLPWKQSSAFKSNLSAPSTPQLLKSCCLAVRNFSQVDGRRPRTSWEFMATFGQVHMYHRHGSVSNSLMTQFCRPATPKSVCFIY